MGGIIELAPGHALSGEQKWQRAVFLIGAIAAVVFLSCISQMYFSVAEGILSYRCNLNFSAVFLKCTFEMYF